MFFNKFQNFVCFLLENEKHSLLHFVPVCAGSGICWYFYLDREPNLWLNLLITALLLLNIFITKYKKTFIALFFIAFGACLAQVRTMCVDTPLLKHKIKGMTEFAAVIDTCEKTPDGMRFIVSNIEKFNLNKMILTWRTDKTENYDPGSRVLFNAKIYPLGAQYFPLAYDFKRQQYFKGISARGFLSDGSEGAPKILCKNAKLSFSVLIEKIRNKINRKIEKILSGDAAAITKALITGEKADISQEVRLKFANSGTAHLLAISGLHMGIIGFFIFWLFRMLMCCILRISQYYDVKKISAVISLIFVIFYLYISGTSIPSVRAFIMHALIIIGILCNRVALSMRSIALAAMVILLFSPEVITFPGFQMSFSAVIAIVALYERRNELGRQKFIFGIILTTIAASIPTSIFSMFSFNQLTLNNILANIVCIPLMTFIIMPIAVISLFFMPFTSLPIELAGQGVSLLIKVVSYASALPGSHFTMPAPAPLTMVIFIFSGLLITLVHHRIRFLGVLGMLCGCVCYCLQPKSDIFISPYGTVIGLRTENYACFNRLDRFKSPAAAWMKSVGLDNKAEFDDGVCKKHARKISKNQYVINYGEDEISIANDCGADIFLSKRTPFARLIYLPDLRIESNKGKRRPWS